jgi:hypothetical protein
MSYTLCYSRLLFQLATRLRSFTLPPTSSTSYPTKAISTPSLHFALFGTTPSYAHLRVFRCTCYSSTSTIAPHKLAPRSCRCVFLRCSSEHKGYRCLNLTTNHLLVSRYIIFDESSFPITSSALPLNNLDSLFSSSPTFRPTTPPYNSSITCTSETVVASRTAPTPTPVPRTASA